MTGSVIYLAEIGVHDGISLTTYRYSNVGFTTEPSDTPSNAHYAQKLLQPVTVGRNIFRSGGATSGRGETSNGTLVLANGDGTLDAIFNTGAIDGRMIRVLQGFAGDAYGDFEPIFRGTMLGQADMDQDTVKIQVRGREQELETPIQSTLYAGNNALPDGLEGGAELSGKPKPVCYGNVRNVTPICVNTAKLIYQVNDQAINGVPRVRDGGVLLQGFGDLTAQTSGFTGFDFILALAYGAGLFVSGGETGKLFTSPDAVTWTSRTSGFSGSDYIRAIAWLNDSLFLAVGDAGQLSTSPDGVTWTAQTSGFGASAIYCASYHAVSGLYIIGGAGGKIATSPDGVTWTMRASAFGGSDIVRGLAVGNSYVVAVGGSGVRGATSPDGGFSWTARSTGLTAGVSLLSVTYGLGVFVAGATDGNLLRTIDGSSWTPVAKPFLSTAAVLSLCFGSGSFLATSDTDAMATSADGSIWTKRGLGGFYASICGGDRFVMAGEVHALYTATPQGSDYANTTDLEDDSMAPLPGCYRVCPSAGYFRLGSPLAGEITCDVIEGASSTDRTKAQLWKRLLEDRASLVSGMDFSATDVTAHDVADAGEAGVYATDPVSLSDVLDIVIAPGSWWMPDRSGVYRVKQFVAPSGTPAASLVASNIKGRLIKATTTDPMAGLPPWKVILYYAPNYTVQSAGLFGGVEVDTRADLAKPWRSVTAEDATVQAKHLLAPTLSLYSNYASETDAQAECDRQLALRKVQRDRFPVPVDATPEYALLDAGDVVEVTHTRFGLAAGRKFVLTGVAPNAQAQSIALELWGGGVNRLYFVDDGAGGLSLSTVAVPAAQFVDDGAGGFALSDDFTLAEAAYFLGQDDGSYALTAA